MIITAPKIATVSVNTTNKKNVVRIFSNNKICRCDVLAIPLTASNKATLVSSTIVKAKMSAIISNVIYSSTDVIEPVSSINYHFNISDLVNGKLTKYHGFNGAVDVSVFNNADEEVEVGVDVSDPNRVTIDLGRLDVTGNWQIKIEK